MNRAALHAWRSLLPDGSVRWLKYSFGPGTANTLATRLDDGGWLVVSPAAGAPPEALEALARDGAVRALLAPNAYHHVGQAAWRQRFPDAVSYAAEGAFARLAKKSAGIEYRSIAELGPRLGARFELVVPAGLKTPDVLVRASSAGGGGTVWWMGDLFSNTSAGDQIWFIRAVVSRLAGSGLGYRRNMRPGLVYVRDAEAWLRSTREAMERHPPSVVLPAHGDPVSDDAARRTREIMATAP